MKTHSFASTLTFCLIHLLNIVYGQKTKTIDMTFVDQDTTMKDTISEQILMSKTWQTCAWVKSADEFRVYQFLPKEIVKGDNCTNNPCTYSDWSFEIDNGIKLLSISNTQGCPGDVVLCGMMAFYLWTFDDLNKTIKLKTSEEDKSEITLLISTVNENRLVLYLVTE